MTQKDDFIGEKFGTLEVVSWSGERLGSQKLYNIECSVCSCDVELYPGGIFKSTKRSLVQGKKPCGCSKRPKYTEYQITTLIKRQVLKSDLIVHGYNGDYHGVLTRLNMECRKCAHRWDSNVNRLLKGVGCPICARHDTRKTDEDVINSILSTGKFREGSKFWNTGRFNNYPHPIWNMICPVCSTDEFVENGLCTGIFESTRESLQEGNLICRCSKRFSWTKEQREYQIQKEISDRNLNYKFTGWINGKYNFKLDCKIHGEFTTSIDTFIHGKSGCKECASYGYKTSKEGSLYILKVDGDYNFTGFGISNNLQQRIASHKRELKKYNCFILENHIIRASGDVILKIEKELKLKFKRSKQLVRGFRTEATESCFYEDVVKYVNNRLLDFEQPVSPVIC